MWNKLAGHRLAACAPAAAKSVSSTCFRQFSVSTSVFFDKYAKKRDDNGDSRKRFGGYGGRNDGGDGYNDRNRDRNDFRGPRNNNFRGGNRDNRGGNRSKFGGNGRSYDSDRDQDSLIGRTKGNRQGSEGDGLRGEDNYEVNIDQMPDFKWEDMKTEIPEDHVVRAGFSGIPVLALAKFKLVSRVLANSLAYNKKYEELTTVQAQTLLPILRGDSVVVRAKTGTGKTAAFAVPTLQQVLEAKRRDHVGVKAVIVSPTRELAQQIADEIHSITQYGELRKIRTQCFVGGLSKQKQIEQGFGRNGPVDIVVATPGRLLDILQDTFILPHFAGLQVKILDEADRLLDIGFTRELDKIRDQLDQASGGKGIPTLLFSATIDKRVRDFAQDEFGGRAKIVDTVAKDEPEAQQLVQQEALLCENWENVYSGTLEAIEKEIADIEATPDKDFKAIIFLPTVRLVDHFQQVVSRFFRGKHNIRSNAIHGQMTQAARQRVSDVFRKSRESILITTDVIARGMDFPLVTHVFQMGSPSDAASYVHRIGRSARAGNSGKSILLIDKLEKRYITDILAKNNIKNITTEIYERSPEFDNEKFQEVCKVSSDEDAGQLYNSLLSSAGQNRAVLAIPARPYIEAQESFQHLIGLEHARLNGAVRDMWANSKQEYRPKRFGRGSFGANSRKTRMKW